MQGCGDISIDYHLTGHQIDILQNCHVRILI